MSINTAEFKVGDAIPSENSLCKKFSASRMTIRKAVDVLIAAGLLERRHGSGTYLKRKDIEYQSDYLNTFTEFMTKTNNKSKSEVKHFSTLRAPSLLANKLKVSEGELLYRIMRIRKSNDIPAQIEESYLPTYLFPDLSLLHLEGSKFNYIESIVGIKIKGCRETFTPIIPTKEQVELLRVPINKPLLQVTSLCESEDGIYVDFSIITTNIDLYPASYYFKR